MSVGRRVSAFSLTLGRSKDRSNFQPPHNVSPLLSYRKAPIFRAPSHTRTTPRPQHPPHPTTTLTPSTFNTSLGILKASSISPHGQINSIHLASPLSIIRGGVRNASLSRQHSRIWPFGSFKSAGAGRGGGGGGEGRKEAKGFFFVPVRMYCGERRRLTALVMVDMGVRALASRRATKAAGFPIPVSSHGGEYSAYQTHSEENMTRREDGPTREGAMALIEMPSGLSVGAKARTVPRTPGKERSARTNEKTNVSIMEKRKYLASPRRTDFRSETGRGRQCCQPRRACRESRPSPAPDFGNVLCTHNSVRRERVRLNAQSD